VSSSSDTPSGMVSFSDESNALRTAALDAMGQATINLSLNAGTHVLAASYSGAPGFNASTAQPISIQVAPATPTVAVSCPTPAFADGRKHPYACTVAVTGDGGGSVSGSVAITYDGSSTAPFRMGTNAVVATITSAEPNYTNAIGAGTLAITHGAVMILTTLIREGTSRENRKGPGVRCCSLSKRENSVCYR
jgi:hypothetical protein